MNIQNRDNTPKVKTTHIVIEDFLRAQKIDNGTLISARTNMVVCTCGSGQ